MLDVNHKYSNRLIPYVDKDAGILNLNSDGPSSVFESATSIDDSECIGDTAFDPVDCIGDKLASFKLLSKDEEYGLALKLSNASRAMALLTISWSPSARELLNLADSAITSAVKKRLFSSEARYFALRREMDDLVKAEGNTKTLPLLMAALRSEPDDKASSTLAEYTSNVDWPGPLMVAFTRRYGSKHPSASMLTLAIDEYLSSINALPKTRRQPCGKHSAQLNHHANAYLNARDALVNHNLRLVFCIAKRHAQRSDYLPDLIQEGACGLIRAAEKFRAATGNRFSTYAYWWIESTVRKARVNIDNVISISHGHNNDLLKISQSVERRKNTHSRPILRALPKELNVSEKRLDTVMGLNQQCLSLDQAISDDGSLSLHTKLADPNSSFTDGIFNQRDAQYLSGVISNLLSEREAYIINERFGRFNSDPKTLQQVSDILGLSCERVRQLEAGALKKIGRWIDREIL